MTVAVVIILSEVEVGQYEDFVVQAGQGSGQKEKELQEKAEQEPRSEWDCT